jgi:hypothetical protein
MCDKRVPVAWKSWEKHQTLGDKKQVLADAPENIIDAECPQEAVLKKHAICGQKYARNDRSKKGIAIGPAEDERGGETCSEKQLGSHGGTKHARQEADGFAVDHYNNNFYGVHGIGAHSTG